MNESTKKLISISGSPLGNSEFQLGSKIKECCGKLANSLEELLAQKNGFYAFESALHVFPAGNSQHMNIENWNSEELWVSRYGSLIEETVFFAEDIFGCQFCIHKEQIYSFDPETADLEYIGDTVEEWASVIIDDYNMWTGYSLAHDWQKNNGAIPASSRLMPKIPFVCEGEYELENLMLIDSVTGMRTRANLATQVANLEDGTQIEFKIIK